jgi:predicted RNase H-like HicB family nuclease
MTNNRNPELWDEAQRLASRGYTTQLSEDTLSDGAKVYLAEHPELPGCMTQGNTLDEALNDLKQITVDFIYYLLEDGLEVPGPIHSQTITGSSSKPLSTNYVQTIAADGFSAGEPESDSAENAQADNKTIMQFSIVEEP